MDALLVGPVKRDRDGVRMETEVGTINTRKLWEALCGKERAMVWHPTHGKVHSPTGNSPIARGPEMMVKARTPKTKIFFEAPKKKA